MPSTPRVAIGKRLLIAGVAATAVSVGHADKAGVLRDPGTAAQAAAPQMCPAAGSDVTIRIGGYRPRHLENTPAARFARGNG